MSARRKSISESRNSSPPAGRTGNLFQHVLHAYQLIVEDLLRDIQKSEHRRVHYRVIDAEAFLASNNDVPAAQYRQLLRYGALLYTQPGAQLVHAGLAVPQRIDDGDPQRMRQRLEELRLKCSNIL